MDIDLVDNGPVKNKGGRPKKITVVAKEDFIPLPGGPKKVRERHAVQGAVLDMPKWLIDTLNSNGIDVMWIAVSARGDEQMMRTTVQGFRQGGGWEPVITDMFPYKGKPIFQGMYYPPEYIGQIEVGGQVLHWRPLELTKQALAEMAKEAAAPLQAARRNTQEGYIEGTNGAVSTQTAKARAWRGLEETIERTVPMPD